MRSSIFQETALFMSVFTLLLAGCSAVRTVPAGDRLYTGAEIKWVDGKHRDKKDMEDALAAQIRPRPNSRFLGMPIRLWLYNLAKKPTGKGLNYLLREKWGEAPVLVSQVKPAYTAQVLQSYAEDNGFFQSSVTGEIDSSGRRRAHAKYIVNPGVRYLIDSVLYDVDTGMAIGRYIKRAEKYSSLKKGRPYSLDQIKEERTHISNLLKNRGYYYFTPDHLIARVDSNHHAKVFLFLQVKDSISTLATTPFRLRRIQLFPNYDLQSDSSVLQADGKLYKNLEIVDPDSLFRPYVLERSVFLRKDSLYRLRDHTITLSRLMNLGTFKFVSTQFTRVRRSQDQLDVRVMMTPYPKHAIQFDLSGNSKSNNYVGSQVSVSLKDRNWLRAADLLEISLSGGVEQQVGGERQLSNNAYNLKAGLAVTIPKFYSPLIHFRPKTPFVPRTKIGVNYEFLRNPGLYNLNGFNFQFGYSWKQSRFIEHVFNPVDISYVLPTHTTAAFDSIIATDPSQREAIQQQFILGSDYTFTYNNQQTRRRLTFHASGNVDFAGNLAGLFVHNSGTGSKELFGTPFAQYIRLSADIRAYWRLNSKDQWVNRIFIGSGFPYGNSRSLPFVKQFFNGGSNSLRGFRARTLGPGTYDSTENRFIANEAGDIKIEFNSELRKHLFSIIEGAAFIDAGNIWLRREDPLRPGSGFRIGSMLQEFAVDAGLGLRVDASILIVRFDLAFPLRKPFLAEGERWVLQDIDFGSSTWRKDNLILNIAIGYPF